MDFTSFDCQGEGSEHSDLYVPCKQRSKCYLKHRALLNKSLSHCSNPHQELPLMYAKLCILSSPHVFVFF